jgi:tetratricopeptide (TPR) repeat protein
LFESADVFFKRSLNIYRRLEDRDGEARTLNSLGNVAYEMGDDEQAKTLYQQSLDIARSIGMTWGLAGTLQQPQADTSQKSLLEQHQRLMQQLTAEVEKNDQRSMAVTYRDLGRVAIKQQKPKEAHDYFQSALEIHQKMSDTAGVIRILREIAMLAQKTDDQTHAQGALMRAVNAGQADDTLRLIALLGWAQYQHAQGQHGLALMTLAFILNAHGLDTSTEDEAEELIYEIEQVLDTKDLENHWEQGKASMLDALLTKLQA